MLFLGGKPASVQPAAVDARAESAFASPGTRQGIGTQVDPPEKPVKNSQGGRSGQSGTEIIGAALTAVAALAFLGLLFGTSKKPSKLESVRGAEPTARPSGFGPTSAPFGRPDAQSGIPAMCGVLVGLALLAVVIVLEHRTG